MPRASHFLRSSTSISTPAPFASARAPCATIVGVIAGAFAGANDHHATVLPTTDVGQDVVEARGATLSAEPVDDRACRARKRLRGLLVVEQRDDRDLERAGIGGPDGTELHSSPPLWTRAGWIARRSCAWLIAGSAMRTRSSPTRRVSP